MTCAVVSEHDLCDDFSGLVLRVHDDAERFSQQVALVAHEAVVSEAGLSRRPCRGLAELRGHMAILASDARGRGRGGEPFVVFLENADLFSAFHGTRIRVASGADFAVAEMGRAAHFMEIVVFPVAERSEFAVFAEGEAIAEFGFSLGVYFANGVACLARDAFVDRELVRVDDIRERRVAMLALVVFGLFAHRNIGSGFARIGVA